MRISDNKTCWLGICAAATIAAGLPAVADDTELLLVNPGVGQQPTPNVLFILDTSGSMDTDESTTQPYDSTVDYGALGYGTCSSDRLYWSDINVVPQCDGTETKFIEKSAYQCDFSTLQISGIGSFTNTMVQYRPSVAGGPASWQTLEPGNSTDPVECRADSGRHGDGSAGRVYATAEAGASDPWTNDAAMEVSWGSAPRNISYTVYDGNYLNWKANPVTVTLTRNDIMRAVIKAVLNSLNNLNVGIMRFNGQDGGTIIQAITSLDDNRTDILATVEGLNAAGNTPLAESLYEAALYWNGLPAYYGENFNVWPTDPDALASAVPEVYRTPQVDVCAKNYNVLLTDGEPNQDFEAITRAPLLPDFEDVLGRTACLRTDEGACMEDISEYMSLVDTDSVTPGMQNVTTHTIGFNIDLPIMRTTAEVSGGEYFLANDVESLTLTLLEIVANINDRSQSFAAPAVSVNTFNRTQNLNNVYLTMFGARPNIHWPGNLKQYRIADGAIVDANGAAAVDPQTGFFYETARSYWTVGDPDGNDVRLGGAASQLPDPAMRNLYTDNSGGDLTTAANQLTPSQAPSYVPTDFGLTGASGEPTVEELIRWARGEDIRDEDDNPATLVRNAMGDPLHSQPAAIVYGGTPENPDVVIFVATNDGYVHAIDGATGQELWAFIPNELLPNLGRLFFDPAARFKNYGVDGDIVPVVKDENKNGIVDGGDFVYLVFGMRRGGSTYYALDVTNKNLPELMWKASYPNFGQSWSAPVVTRLDINTGGQNADDAVLIIGDGYDPVHDSGGHPTTDDGVGAGITILDLESGAELWRASRTSLDLPLADMTRAIASRIRVLDISGDGFADRMYAADMGGQIWRFDLFSGQTPANLATGGVIAQLGAEGLSGSPQPADIRRFYNTPDVSIFTDPLQDRRYLAVSIGSGYRAHPFDQSAEDRFFSLRDPDVFNQLEQTDYDNYDVIVDSDLVEVSGQLQVELTPADRGWRFTLPASQKVLADSITFDNSVFFVAFSPQSNAAQTCSAGAGTNFLYRVSVINGDPVVTNLDALTPEEADDARRSTLAQGGIAPSPTILFPSPEPTCSGDDCSPPPVGCVGVECFNPGFDNDPVRTLWSQDGIN